MAIADDESEFNYDEDSDQGPHNRGDIKPEWFRCKNGTMQSPIDLLNHRVQIVSNLGGLQINYTPSNATLKNRGHDIRLELIANSSYLQINGTQYVLKQLHWHSPSEHTIDGKRLDLELHLVHETPSGETAVIGILYKTGLPDLFLSLVKFVSKEQIELLQVAVHNDSDSNARPLQPLNNRLVQLNKLKEYPMHL
ncbi:putative carbonic anhydrase [Medicago truncatula]|uniref:Putative carbonic anhydrase n=1 Tax=Medicago truncatula TaxID=3880 RepID=A0A396I8Z0_MEDTR|nr:putative carbonic anhydrase [Medicago truncatula]